MTSHTPTHLLEALDLVTARRPPSAEALGRVGARHVSRVRDVFEDRNIVAVGISEKVTDKIPTGALSLCFYVEKKIPKSRLRLGKFIPPVTVASNQAAVFTDVKQIGRVRPEGRIRKKVSPIQSGFSIAHIDVGAGTVGAIVRKAKTLFVLSNSHVLANAGLAKLKDEIVYPSPNDGGALPKSLAGTLAKFIKFRVGGDFVNRVDAALIAIDKDRLKTLDLSIHGVKGRPRVIAPRRGMTVVKRGRTTGETQGTIQDVNFRVVIEYEGVGQVGFTDQVLCTRYSRPGDSGSIVVDKASGQIVGLHFAGANGGSVFNPIANVIAALKFQFA